MREGYFLSNQLPGQRFDRALRFEALVIREASNTSTLNSYSKRRRPWVHTSQSRSPGHAFARESVHRAKISTHLDTALTLQTRARCMNSSCAPAMRAVSRAPDICATRSPRRHRKLASYSTLPETMCSRAHHWAARDAPATAGRKVFRTPSSPRQQKIWKASPSS